MRVRMTGAVLSVALLALTAPTAAFGQKPPGETAGAAAPATSEPERAGVPVPGTGMLSHVDIGPITANVQRLIQAAQSGCDSGTQSNCQDVQTFQRMIPELDRLHTACHADDTAACRRYIEGSDIVLQGVAELEAASGAASGGGGTEPAATTGK